MNSIEIVTQTTSNYKKIILKEVCEPILLTLMNDSEQIFPEVYEQITEQSNNESDFKNVNKEEFYDVKVLFENEICRLISKEASQWIGNISKKSSETYNAIMNGSDEDDILERISQIPLYKVFKERIVGIDPDEKCILFLPFPLTIEMEGSLTTSSVSTKYHLVIRALKKYGPELLLGKDIFIIYPNLENKVVLRKLFDGTDEVFDIEFIQSNVFNDYIRVTSISN